MGRHGSIPVGPFEHPAGDGRHGRAERRRHDEGYGAWPDRGVIHVPIAAAAVAATTQPDAAAERLVEAPEESSTRRSATSPGRENIAPM